MPNLPSATHSEAVTSADDAAPEAPDRDRWVVRAALVLTLLPLLVSAVSLTVGHGNGYHPVGDNALTELVTRDVGRHWVLLGPFSRDGWHHPGPALYYLLALPYRLLGSTATALDVAALVINGGSIAGMAAIARRRGGMPLTLLTLLGCALLVRALGPDELRWPWNPYVTVLPYGLLVFLTWSAMCRDRWALPVAVFVASYVAQAHIGYVALALPLVVLGAAWLAATVPGRALRVPAATAVSVAVVMWLPPLIQQLTTEPGNLGLAFRWFRGGGPLEEQPSGYVAGWRVVSAQYGLPPEWLWGARPITWFAEPEYRYAALAPWLLVVVAAGGMALWRKRPPGGRRLMALWAFASAVAVVATARTIGPVFEYRLGWSRVLGMVAGIIVAWAGWLAATRWHAAVQRRVLVPVSMAGLAVLAVVSSVAHVEAGEPVTASSARLRHLMPEVIERLAPGSGPVLVDGSSSGEGRVYESGVVLDLERHGVDARLPEGNRAAGEHRMYDGGELRAHLLIAAGEQIPVVEAQSGTTLIAYDGEVSLNELKDEIAARGPPPADTAVAIFLVDP